MASEVLAGGEILVARRRLRLRRHALHAVERLGAARREDCSNSAHRVFGASSELAMAFRGGLALDPATRTASAAAFGGLRPALFSSLQRAALLPTPSGSPQPPGPRAPGGCLCGRRHPPSDCRAARVRRPEPAAELVAPGGVGEPGPSTSSGHAARAWGRRRGAALDAAASRLLSQTAAPTRAPAADRGGGRMATSGRPRLRAVPLWWTLACCFVPGRRFIVVDIKPVHQNADAQARAEAPQKLLPGCAFSSLERARRSTG